jgi:exonuclease III
MLGSLLAVAPLVALSAARTSGTFNLMTYNVAGLPAILNGNDESGDKTTNAGTIGTKLAQGDFDVVHMQEVRVTSDAEAKTKLQPGLQLPCVYLRY